MCTPVHASQPMVPLEPQPTGISATGGAPADGGHNSRWYGTGWPGACPPTPRLMLLSVRRPP